MQPGWVYVLDDGQGHYKIGKAKDLTRRVRDLRIQLPWPITVNYAFQSTNYHQDERTLHQHFKHKRLNGEWFDLELDDLGAIYEFAGYRGLYEWCGEMVRDPMYTVQLNDERTDALHDQILWADDVYAEICEKEAEAYELMKGDDEDEPDEFIEKRVEDGGVEEPEGEEEYSFA